MGHPSSRGIGPGAYGVAALVAAAAAAWLLPGFRLYQLSGAGILAVAMIGVTILTGRCGQLSLGHGAFIGIGAYTAAIAVRDLGVPYAIAVVGAAAMGFLAGLAIGIPAGVLPVNSIAVVTLTGALALPQTIKKLDGLTGGSYGIFLPRDDQLASPWRAITTDQFCYLVVLGTLALACLLGSNLVRGRWALAMMAIRDHPVAAASMGIALPRTKAIAFATSGAFAGAAGGLHVALVGSITPNDIALAVSFTLVTGAVIGGLGSVAGAVLGALFVTLVPEYTSHITPSAPGFAIGAVTVAVAVVAPGGLIAGAPSIRRAIDERRSARLPAGGPHAALSRSSPIEVELEDAQPGPRTRGRS